MKCAILYRKPTSQEMKIYKRAVSKKEVVKKALVALYFLIIVGIVCTGISNNDEVSSCIILSMPFLIYDIKHIRRAIRCYRQYQRLKKGQYEVSELEIDNERFVYKDIGRERSVIMNHCYVCAYRIQHLECEALMIRESYETIYNEQRAMLIKMPIGNKNLYYISHVVK